MIPSIILNHNSYMDAGNIHLDGGKQRLEQNMFPEFAETHYFNRVVKEW